MALPGCGRFTADPHMCHNPVGRCLCAQTPSLAASQRPSWTVQPLQPPPQALWPSFCCGCSESRRHRCALSPLYSCYFVFSFYGKSGLCHHSSPGPGRPSSRPCAGGGCSATGSVGSAVPSLWAGRGQAKEEGLDQGVGIIQCQTRSQEGLLEPRDSRAGCSQLGPCSPLCHGAGGSRCPGVGWPVELSGAGTPLLQAFGANATAKPTSVRAGHAGTHAGHARPLSRLAQARTHMAGQPFPATEAGLLHLASCSPRLGLGGGRGALARGGGKPGFQKLPGLHPSPSPQPCPP